MAAGPQPEPSESPFLAAAQVAACDSDFYFASTWVLELGNFRFLQNTQKGGDFFVLAKISHVGETIRYRYYVISDFWLTNSF